MNLKTWNATINEIMAESNQEPTMADKLNILAAWRAKLENEPISLPPHEITEIMREVRTRLYGVLR